jgi:hypothetical protein
MTESSVQHSAPHRLADEFMRWLGGRSKTSLAVSAALCFAIFWFLGYVAGIPFDRGFNGSLLAQGSPIISVLVTAIGLFACTLLISVVQSHAEVEDPLLAVAAGLIALSCRGGTMTNLLQISSLNIFWVLIVELVLLYAMLTGCWALLRWMRQRRSGAAALLSDNSNFGERFLCTLVAAIVMGLCMYLLAQTEAKKQVLAAVGISAFAGAAVSYAFFDIHTVPCYALAPLAVGIFGYLSGYFIPAAWMTGRIGQPLAYPLPLDYAGLGIAGSLLGYWTAHKWKEEGQG